MKSRFLLMLRNIQRGGRVKNDQSSLHQVNTHLICPHRASQVLIPNVLLYAFASAVHQALCCLHEMKRLTYGNIQKPVSTTTAVWHDMKRKLERHRKLDHVRSPSYSVSKKHSHAVGEVSQLNRELLQRAPARARGGFEES